MALTPPTGTPKLLLERKDYPARCFGMINTGTYEDTYKGQTQTANKVWLWFEIPSEMRVFDEAKGEQPKSVNVSFNFVLTKTCKLTKFLESWRGKAFEDEERTNFDMLKLLGAPCVLEVGPNALGTREDIFSIKKMPKHFVDPDTGEKVEMPAQINPSRVIDFDNLDHETLEWLPDFLKERVKSSEEYQAVCGQVPSAEEDNDESVPF